MKENNELGAKHIMQVAVAVKDIEKTAKRLADIFQMDVPQIFDNSNNVDEYRGKATKSYVKTCYFQMGQVDLELIQPYGDNIAAGAFLKKNDGPGIQHISFKVENIDEKCKYLESKGLEVIQKTKPFQGGKAYYFPIPEIGADLELIEGPDRPE